MNSAIPQFLRRLPMPRDTLLVALWSLPMVVLASMDQCTRGPSLTAMLLTHLDLFF